MRPKEWSGSYIALQATFTANFSDFDRAVKSGVDNLNVFDFKISGTQRALQQMTSSLDGSKLIREATLAAAAVEKIGGVSKLTEDEQRKLNDTLQKSIDKYHALGQDAPSELRKVADETQKAVKAADDLREKGKTSGESMVSLGGIATSLGGVLASAFTVTAVASFAKDVIDLGGDIADLSNRTGIGTRAIQELKYAAEQTGSSIDTVTGAIEQMGNRLTEGKGGTVGALRTLGLSLDDLRKKRPEDAFTAIADAIKDVPDPMQQTQLAMELFGKSGTEILPAIKTGIGDLRGEAEKLGQVMSEDAVEGLDTLGDKWGQFTGAAKASVGELVSSIARAASDLKGIAQAIEVKPQTGAEGPRSKFSAASTLGDRAFAEAQKRAQEIQRVLDSVKAPELFSGKADAFTANMPSFEEMERSAKAQMQAVEAALDHARAVKALGDAWRAADLTKQIELQETAFRTLTPQQRANSDVTKKIVEDYGKLRSQVGASALPRDLEQFYQAHLPLIKGTRDLIDVTGHYATATLPDLSRAADEARNKLAGLTSNGLIPTSKSFGDLFDKMNVPAPVGLVNIAQQVSDNRERMSEWANDTRNILGDMRRDFSGYFADALTGQMSWKDAALGIWDSFKRGVTDILASILDSFINSFIKGITNALLGAQGGWAQAFAGAFGGVGGGGAGGATIAGTTSLAGVSGTASVAGGIGGGSFTGVGAGTGAGASGGTFGGLGVTGALGAGVAGGAGLGLGLLGTQIFGGSGWKASGFGAASGAATGALIGTYVFPGVGTALGAGIGGAAGAIGGWIGKSQGEKVNDARDEFLMQFGPSGLGENSGFHNLARELDELNQLGMDTNRWFKELTQADSFDELNRAVKGIADALSSTEYSTLKVRHGFEDLTVEAKRMADAGLMQDDILKQQAGSYSLLFDAIKKSGAEVPEALTPILQTLRDMGLLVDEAGNKVTDLSAVAFAQLRETFGAVGTAGAESFEAINKQIDEFIERGVVTAEQAAELRKQFASLDEGAEAIEGTSEELDQLSEKGIISKDVAKRLREELMKQDQARILIEDTTGSVDALGSALADASRDAERLHDQLLAAASVQAPSVPSGSPSGSSAPSGYDVPSFASGGVGNFGRGTLAMLYGREAIIPLDRLAGGGSGASRPIHIHLEADGQRFAHAVVPYIPGVLAFHGAIR